LIDTDTEFGARAARRLRKDLIAWLVTVSADGTPQPTPVWFLDDGSTILVYSAPKQAKLRNIQRNPHVALHLDSRKHGDDIVIVTGTATVDGEALPVHHNDAYVKKYGVEIVRIGLRTPETMAKTYSVAIRIVPAKVRGF
jgi:PPOX class probable F420-dependent enzyme